MSERGLNHLDNMIQNEIIQPLLTDLYQFTMAYSYWKSGKMNDIAIFDLYFRKNPFHGEFTVFAGLEECMKFLEKFHISDSDLHYLKKILPSSVEPEFFQYLKALTVNDVILSAIDEGTVVFPKVPLIKVEGPLPVVQILETCFLNLINYASLVATNAVRFRLAAGPEMGLFEFGLRRAQGPDGALSASRYCYLGGFDGTSNVLAGKLYGIPLKGTHAHAFVTSFSDTQSLTNRVLKRKDNGKEVDFVNVCLMWKEKLSIKLSFMKDQVSDGELAAFATYAISFPNAFLALIDTYDVIKSGLPNFCAVAMALHELGYEPKGIRLDSGDLAYLSQVSRETFQIVSKIFNLPMFARLKIVASNDINEDTIHSLNQQNHQIDCYGIGTHLVTCQKQPALGCVFKLVEINGKPRIKLSEDPEKITIPGKKNVYRLYGTDGIALVDLLQQQGEPAPCVGERVFCRHPFQETKRAYVLPAKVENLYKVYWKDGKVQQPLPKLTQLRDKTMQSLQHMRQDHKRALQPSPYKVSVSANLYTFMHELWLQNAPIGELS